MVKGSLWTLQKSVFVRQRENVDYPNAAVSSFFTYLPPLIFWHLSVKKQNKTKQNKTKKKKKTSHCKLRGNCLRVPTTNNGTILDINNFPHTRGLRPMVAIHKCGLMLSSHINTDKDQLRGDNWMLSAHRP